MVQGGVGWCSVVQCLAVCCSAVWCGVLWYSGVVQFKGNCAETDTLDENKNHNNNSQKSVSQTCWCSQKSQFFLVYFMMCTVTGCAQKS